jgi:hypothetical protein
VCAAFIAGIAIVIVAASVVGRAEGPPSIPVRAVVLFLAALPSVLILGYVRRRRGSLYRFVNGPQVEIQADGRGFQLHIDDDRRTIPWQEIAVLRTGGFPWYSTLILDASGRELAVVPVAPEDPLSSDDDRRSSIGRLLISNNPGQFVAAIGFGGDVRVRRVAPGEVGAVEAELVAQTKLRARIFVIVIVVITVLTVAAFLLRS